MTDCREGMVEEHPGTDVSHYLADFLAVLGRIAVYLAFAAARLSVAFRAAVETPVSVIQEGATLVAQIVSAATVMLAAVDGNHLADCFLLLFYAFHNALDKFGANLGIISEASAHCGD